MFRPVRCIVIRLSHLCLPLCSETLPSKVMVIRPVSPIIIFFLTFTALLGAHDQAQTPRSSVEDPEQSLSINTAEVPLDVVIRDRRGRLVKGLTASDFEVYEDGVRQQITSLRFVSRETNSIPPQSGINGQGGDSPVATTAAASRPTTSLLNGGQFRTGAVALVFDRLSPESRTRARQAALKYVSESVKPDDLVGVFLTDLSLNFLQPYTNDAQLIRRAIERVGSISPSLYTSSNERAREVRSDLAKELYKSKETRRDQSRSAAAVALEMQLRALERWEELQRDQQGQATSNGLLAIADSLRPLPGRKTIIFFSEGVAIPTDVAAQFRAVISASNRSNVSIYVVDAAGLRAESLTAETRKEVESRSELRMARIGTQSEDLSGALTKGLERNEDLLRLNPESGLGQLASQTGGFLIRETNNLSAGLRRIDEDMRSYYLLSYEPKNQNWDGRFRAVEVKVRRAELSVQSRQGYYGLSPTYASAVLPYEAPALALLSNNRRPHELVVHAAGVSFPEPKRPGLVPIFVEVPARFVTFAGSNQSKQFETDFSVMVLVKNERQQVVKKLSNHYRLNGPLDKLESARRGEVLFYREAELEPGRYTMEAVVYDALSNKAGVEEASIEIPNHNEAKLQVSSVVLIRRAEPLSASEKEGQANPFHYGEVVIYPELSSSIAAAAAKQLGFYLTMYPRAETLRPLRLMIEIRQGERIVGRTTGEVPLQSGGKVQYAGVLPLKELAAGSYELRVTVGDEADSVTRTKSFTIKENKSGP